MRLHVMTGSPNFLLIICDQLRADHVGYVDESPVSTPVLDGLASRGMVFDNAYSAATNCAPARGSLLTGLPPHRYPGHEGGIVAEGRSLKPGFWTIAHELRSNGYRTGYFGKGHFRPIHANHGFAEMRMVEHMRAYSGGPRDNPIDDWTAWMVWQGRADHSATHLFGADKETSREYQERWTAVPFGHPEAFHPTTWVTDEAIRFVEKERERGDRPWFAVVSYPHPHAPLDPPAPYDTMYDPAEVELPPTYTAPAGGLPDWWTDQLTRVGRQVPGNEDTARRALAYYRGLITQIDDNLSRLFDHIDLAETTVCFTADHGDYGGHKNRMFKNPLIPFDDLARVPLVWLGAGVATGRRADLVQSSDFAPTALEMAGIDRPIYMHDLVSLAPILSGGAGDPDRIVFTLDRSGGNAAARMHDDKLIRSAVTGDDVLFDLAADPEETATCAGDPAKADILEELQGALTDYQRQSIPDLPYFT